MSSAKIAHLQLLQQNLQNMSTQKQQLESQLAEYDSALTELKTTDNAYKIIGKLMIASPKDALIEDLQQKKELVEVRVKNFSKQQEKLRIQIEEAQQRVMAELKKEKK